MDTNAAWAASCNKLSLLCLKTETEGEGRGMGTGAGGGRRGPEKRLVGLKKRIGRETEGKGSRQKGES